MDIKAGTEMKFHGIWQAREAAVSHHYASIGYVAKIRTKEGKVIAMRPDSVVEAAQEFQEDFSEEDLNLESGATPTAI